MPLGVDHVEAHLVRQTLAEKVEDRSQEAVDPVRTMHHQVAGAPQHPEGRDQSRQPEAVVAMQVRDEYVPDPAELEPHAPDLHLRPFAAVDHIKFVTEVHDLGGRQVACGRQRGTAAEYVQFKISHRV